MEFAFGDEVERRDLHGRRECGLISAIVGADAFVLWNNEYLEWVELGELATEGQ